MGGELVRLASTMLITNCAALALTPARELAFDIVEAAVKEVMPEPLLRRKLAFGPHGLVVGGQPVASDGGRLWVLGAGKAAAAMAAAVETLLGPERIHGGLVVTAPGWDGPTPQRVTVLTGDHPVPGASSAVATAALLAVAGEVTGEDVVLWLLSGGASSLLAAPAPGLSLEHKQQVTRALLRSGATIDEMNAVRKHLSSVKGGQLARLLAPATVITLALSDVVSGRLDVIGSGPTAPDSSTFADALAVLDAHGLRSIAPRAVVEHLERGAAGGVPETPKPGDPCFAGARACVIGSPAHAAEAALAAARSMGVPEATLVDAHLGGDVRAAAAMLGARLRSAAFSPGPFPKVLVAAGEVTVQVHGDGRGGRCQELAATLISEIAGLPITVVCAATDGQDFIEGAGGAVVDGYAAGVAASLSIAAGDALDRHDTHPLHRALGTLIEARPTGTNVCDLIVAVVEG